MIIGLYKLSQKKEKLLELYKELSELYEKLYHIDISILRLIGTSEVTEIIRVKHEIEVLENDK